MPITFPADIARFFPVEFDLDARRVDDDQVRAATAQAGGAGVADVLVLSHGWNNHKEEALGLYTNLLGNVAKQNRRRLDVDKTAVVGVFWPSKKFADRDLIPGGAGGRRRRARRAPADEAPGGLGGQVGLAPALREVRLAAPEVRIHLAGHSFGVRLVTAAALGGFEGDPLLPASSLTLLQAAFSHHGFAEGWRPGRNGYFRRVITERRVAASPRSCRSGASTSGNRSG